MSLNKTISLAGVRHFRAVVLLLRLKAFLQLYDWTKTNQRLHFNIYQVPKHQLYQPHLNTRHLVSIPSLPSQFPNWSELSSRAKRRLRSDLHESLRLFPDYHISNRGAVGSSKLAICSMHLIWMELRLQIFRRSCVETQVCTGPYLDTWCCGRFCVLNALLS